MEIQAPNCEKEAILNMAYDTTMYLSVKNVYDAADKNIETTLSLIRHALEFYEKRQAKKKVPVMNW